MPVAPTNEAMPLQDRQHHNGQSVHEAEAGGLVVEMPDQPTEDTLSAGSASRAAAGVSDQVPWLAKEISDPATQLV